MSRQARPMFQELILSAPSQHNPRMNACYIARCVASCREKLLCVLQLFYSHANYVSATTCFLVWAFQRVAVAEKVSSLLLLSCRETSNFGKFQENFRLIKMADNCYLNNYFCMITSWKGGLHNKYCSIYPTCCESSIRRYSVKSLHRNGR